MTDKLDAATTVESALQELHEMFPGKTIGLKFALGRSRSNDYT